MKRLAFMLAAFLSCGAAPSVSGTPIQQPALEGEYAHDQARILENLRPALGTSGGIARLYYAAKCGTGNSPPPIPPIQLQPPADGSTGLSAVRQIFKNNEDVAVTEEPKGIVRIRIGDVPEAILRTRIRVLALQPFEQYDSRFAISALEDTKEMKAAMLVLGLHVASAGGSWLVAQPQTGRPHLPPLLRDITADQALDLVAERFRGIVIYGICAQPSGNGRFYIDFAGLGQ